MSRCADPYAVGWEKCTDADRWNLTMVRSIPKALHIGHVGHRLRRLQIEKGA